MPKWKFLLIGFVLCLLAGVIAAVVYGYGTYQHVFVQSAFKTPEPSAAPHVELGFNDLEPYSVLMLGYGGGTHEGGKLSDSMILAYVVPKKQHIYLISVPRDLWVQLPTNKDSTSYWKINAAYAIGSDDRKYPNKPAQFTGPAGGGEMAKAAIEQVTGLPVNHFVALSFEGFRKSIDVLKGVNVKVEKTFDDFQYPIEGKEDDLCGITQEEVAVRAATMSATVLEKSFDCRYEHLHFDKGLTKMDGTTALKYVRSRHSAQSGGDFERSARQRTLILGVKDRVLSLDFFSKIIPFISNLTYDMQTDIPLAEMQKMLQYKDDLSQYEISSMALTQDNVLKITTSSNGQSIVVPRSGVDQWQEVKDWIQTEMAKSDTASGSAQKNNP
jgi:anionic cell wall polymer biosynthesis LytR-Cps2A-Psr (LCP) family protein